MAVNETSYYHLRYYKEVEGASETFLNYRLSVSGGDNDSQNLYILDNALHAHDVLISNLEARPRIYPFDVTYNAGTSSYDVDGAPLEITGYTSRMLILVKPDVTSTGSVTITFTNFVSLKTKGVYRVDATGSYIQLGANDFIENRQYLLIYDAAQLYWVLIGTTDYDVKITGTSTNLVSISSTNGIQDSGYSASNFAPSSKGVTYGDFHDHSTNGTGGGTISYASLSNTPVLPATNTAPTNQYYNGYNATTGNFSASEVTWGSINKTSSNIADINSRSHTDLTNIGYYTHANLDSHVNATNNIHGVGIGSDVVGTNTTQTIQNKNLTDTTTSIVNTLDANKKIIFSSNGTTNTSTTLSAVQTGNITLTLPNATTTLVGNNTSDTLTNKTLSDATTTIANSVDATKQIFFSSAGNTNTYTIIKASQTSNITVTLPNATTKVVGVSTLAESLGLSVLANKGDIVVGGANATPITLAVNTTNGYVLTTDTAEPSGMKWALASGGGSTYSTLTNKFASNMVAGDVAVFYTSANTSFTATNYVQDLRIMGVLKDNIATNATGSVYTMPGTVVTVNCNTGAVAVGQYLTSSTTAGQAQGSGYTVQPGDFAVALSSKTAGSTGTVSAILLDNSRQAIVGTSGWQLGGFVGTGTTVTAYADKMTMPTETWAGVSGANLPVAMQGQGGISYSNVKGYSMSGSTTNADAGITGNVYSLSYTSETSSTLTAWTSNIRGNFRLGLNFSSKGFVAGGVNTSGTTQPDIRKMTFSTDSHAMITAVLSTARTWQGGISDGTYLYIGGGSSTTTNRLDNATETISSSANYNLGNSGDGYGFISFPANYGYRVYNDGTNSYSRRFNFSTATDANNGSSPTGNLQYGGCVTDGIGLGYMTSASAATKLDNSTSTYSSSSATSYGRRGAAMSNGAY